MQAPLSAEPTGRTGAREPARGLISAWVAALHAAVTRVRHGAAMLLREMDQPDDRAADIDELADRHW